MFLNQRHKKLTLDYRPKRQDSFLNTFGKFNKRSYSSSALKQEFQIFKNKSMSYSSLHNKNIDNNKSQTQNYKTLYKEKPIAYEFKKSYLHSDSKLNRCALHKQNFKPFNNRNINQNQGKICQKYPTFQQQQKESSRLSKNKDFMQSLQKMNELLKNQNQQLRKQRKADLELIAKQSNIIKNQQNLLCQNLLNKNSETQSQIYKQKSKKNSKPNTKEALQCKQCKTKKFQHIQDQFQDLRIQKLEQQRKQLRKQIHALVFKCQNYKNQIKSLNQKYEKQIIHNEKLIRLLYPQQLQEKYSKPNSEYLQYHKNSSMKNLHIGNQRQKHQNKQSFKDSFKDSCKQSIIDTFNATNKLQKQNNSNANKYNTNFSNKSSKDFEWCQNKNIKKYLQQINREKKQEIDHIQSLLRYS